MKPLRLLSTAAAVFALAGAGSAFAQSPSQVQEATPPEARSPNPPVMPAEIQAPPVQSGTDSAMRPGTQTPMPSDAEPASPPALTPPATPSASTGSEAQRTPAPIVVDTKVDLRSKAPQSPESAADARKEAAAALAEARSACRGESDKQACLQRAREDANALKAAASAKR